MSYVLPLHQHASAVELREDRLPVCREHLLRRVGEVLPGVANNFTEEGFRDFWTQEGNRGVTYWLGREHWGKGVATRALAAFLEIETARPLHAAVAADNAGSIRVLEKCGFTRAGGDRGFATARGEEIDEVFFLLR